MTETSSGRDVDAIGLIFSARIIGIGQNAGINVIPAEDRPDDKSEDEKLITVLSGDYSLSKDQSDEEETTSDISSLNTVVPVMIRTKDGWEFKAPSRKRNEQKGQEQKVDWM